MLNGVLAVLAGGAVLFMGIRESGKISSRARLLSQLCASGGRIRILIEYSRSHKRQLIEELELENTDLLLSMEERSDIENELSRSRPQLKKEEAEFLAEFISELGESEIGSQKKLLNRYDEFFREALLSAEKQKKERGKLYITLGALAGAAVTVILI